MLSWVAYMRGALKPTSEVGLLEALAKHIFGHEFTPGLMKTVVLARTRGARGTKHLLAGFIRPE